MSAAPYDEKTDMVSQLLTLISDVSRYFAKREF